MVLNAVHRACDFFDIPEVPVINSEGTCVWPNGTTTYEDDVFGFNREQLQELGVSGEDSLTLIYTHECAHRTLQGFLNDAWEEELACDFFAGLHAGMKGIDLNNFEASLGITEGGATHPCGALRAEFIEYGKQVAQEMQDRNIEPTYDNCIEHLNQHLTDKQELITEYRSRIDPDYDPTKQPIAEAKGLVNDKAWNEKQAQNNFENAKWHENEAAKAADRGDHAKAKEHLQTALSYNSKGNDYLRSAGQCTK